MAISKQQKQELMELYKKWVAESDGLIFAHYHKLSVKDISSLRKEIRESGGEFHVIKNTLAKRVFEESGREWKEEIFIGPTALGISYENTTGLAKVLKNFAKQTGTIEIKGGYLAEKLMSVEEITAMAELPSMAEMQSILLRTISAPASQLVRTLAEPGRQVAAVLKSYSEQEPAA
ncbi:MAG: 50S ribosomal protein L10 [Chloroflexi bacterium]|nr:50S ribosomal protein L10 [Chloroflexota bacterium]